MVKRFLTLIVCLIPVNFIKVPLLRLLGNKIEGKASIGISIVYVRHMELRGNARIGHLNFIKIDSLSLGEKSFINHRNYCKGPFDIHLKAEAGIGHLNKIRRGNPPVTYGGASLELGINSFIVSGHHIDLTRSVTLGKHSILAGMGSQLWTHGYYHANQGAGRIRIDGEIRIGDNVYVGSNCVFNPGVNVGHSIHIGAGAVISKDLTETGMYVSQPLRYMPNDLEKVRNKLKPVTGYKLVEEVYTK